MLGFSLCPDRIECEQIKSLARNFKVTLYFEIRYFTQSCNSIEGPRETEGGRGGLSWAVHGSGVYYPRYLIHIDFSFLWRR
jgi:hypothetical protein